VQGRKGEDYSFLEELKDRDGTLRALCERAFVRALNGGCSSPVAAHARMIGDEIYLMGLYYDEATKGWLKGGTKGPATQEGAERIGRELADTLRREYQKVGKEYQEQRGDTQAAEKLREELERTAEKLRKEQHQNQTGGNQG